MRILKENKKQGEVSLQVETLDDLWYLSQIIGKGDLIKGRTLRKVKSASETPSSAGERRPVVLEIRVEKVEWSPDAISLRVNGVITQAPKEIPLADHHTFALEPQSTFTLTKRRWLKHEDQRLHEAAAEASSSILLVVFDREEVFIAKLKKSGVEILVHEKGHVQKKDVDTQVSKDFFLEIAKLIEDYQRRFLASAVIIGSPAFWKDELLKRAVDIEGKDRWILATVSDVSATAFNELVRRPEVKKALSQSRVSIESSLVEEILVAIAKSKPVAYGFKEVASADDSGAIETLLISTAFITSHREANTYEDVESLLRECESKKGSIHVISSLHDAGKRLDGLGGIAAILRFSLV